MEKYFDHRKVYGAGFHAGLKAAGGKIEEDNRPKYDATNAMLCWNPGTAEVALIPWPDTERRSFKYQNTSLACFVNFSKMPFEKRKTMVFIEAMRLIIMDRCDPQAVHQALFDLKEYRDGILEDFYLGGIK